MAGSEPGPETWTQQSSAFDRIRSVAVTVSQPRPASYIAEEARVTENTAREHLARLVEMGVLLKSNSEGQNLYSPDPLHTRKQAVRELLDSNDPEALVQHRSELEEKIESWQDDHEVDSLEELRERAATTDTAAETRNVLKTVTNWELVAYRLGLVEEAIEFQNC